MINSTKLGGCYSILTHSVPKRCQSISVLWCEAQCLGFVAQTNVRIALKLHMFLSQLQCQQLDMWALIPVDTKDQEGEILSCLPLSLFKRAISRWLAVPRNSGGLGSKSSSSLILLFGFE